MRLIVFSILYIASLLQVVAQKNLDRTLRQLNKESVPYLQVSEFDTTTPMVILDTRMKEEYDVSHIKEAVWVGYKAFEPDSVLKKIPAKDTPILVYCSIGVRSEDIGERLQKEGYTNIKNLYGGIFEWKNQGHAVYNAKAMETDSVHTFNKQWGKLLKAGIKVY